jgi:hypothetical protein
MTKAKSTNRRNFLLAAGLGGVGAAAAVVTATTNKPAVPGAEPAVDKSSTYRMTEHIEKYYKTTEV